MLGVGLAHADLPGEDPEGIGRALKADGHIPGGLPVQLLKTPGGAGDGEAPGPGNLQPENLAAIKEGMLGVTQTGSLSAAFRDLPVAVGAKTGSAQVAAARPSNAVLVAFAPYEDPQVALALVAEEGGSGSALGEVAAAILEAYFDKI